MTQTPPAASASLLLIADAARALGAFDDGAAALAALARLGLRLPADLCWIDLAEDSGATRRATLARRGGSAKRREPLPGDSVDSLIAEALRTHLPVTAQTPWLGGRCLVCAPLLAGGRARGTLSVVAAKGRDYSADDHAVIATLAACAALVGENVDLRERVERYRRAIDQADFVLYERDYQKPIFTFMGERIKQITGYAPEEMTVAIWRDMIRNTIMRGAAAGESLEQAIERTLAGTLTAWRADYHIRARGGEERWVADASIQLLDAAGKPVGSLGLLHDITDRKRAEQALNAAYERERRIAETLQEALLLQLPEDAFPGLAVEPLYHPAWEEAHVGGDFYDAFALHGGKVALVVGDASGKGLLAAARTAEVKYALRAFLRADPEARPGLALARLNDFICEAQDLMGQSGGRFLCLALAVVDTATDGIAFAVAGAEPPLLLRAEGAAEIVDVGGLALGVEPEEVYATREGRLMVGDTLLMATDGITEARRQDTFLGVQGMVRLAEARGVQASLRQIGEAVVAGARAFAGGALADDVCLLLARRR